MRARLIPCVAALALAVLATPAAAQEQTVTPSPTATPSPSATPTPTPTATPTPEERRDERDRKAKAVRSIYRDFERDGRIDDCDHTERSLKRARRSIEDSYAEERPDFREALTAAIERHNAGRCEEQREELDRRNNEATPTPTATPAPSGGGSFPSPAPAPDPAPAPPSTSPDSGALPDFGAGGGSGDGGAGSGQLDPLPEAPGEDAIPEGTASPAPPAATPTPEPRLIVTRAAASPDMFVPGTLLAVALLGLLIAGATALASKRSERLAGVGHAWREAAWRTSGAWSDFTDWLRSRR